MEKIEIYKRIIELEDQKEKHNKEFADAIRNQADRNSPHVFTDGPCSVCDEIDTEILALETLLTIQFKIKQNENN